MSDNKNRNNEDDFWNLDNYAKRPSRVMPSRSQGRSTDAVEITSNTVTDATSVQFTEQSISKRNTDRGTITRFIPPHKDSFYTKKQVLLEYTPSNPLIKNIKLCSTKEEDQIFPQNNLFMRERRAILSRKAEECAQVSFYSLSPRYSQMSRSQLNWYVWWRENVRKGVFLKTDESYIILYAYELVSSEADDDLQAALRILCSLLSQYDNSSLNPVFKLMIRDMICDFCLVHALSFPTDLIKSFENMPYTFGYFPEVFIDLSNAKETLCTDVLMRFLSLYDYKKSKFYSPENTALFNTAMNGSLTAIICNDDSFNALTSFANGVYGCVTTERKPFQRMSNIVNKNISLEITYYQLTNLQTAVTDAMRYAENRLREYLGIKNKLHVLSVNPAVKSALDDYFDKSFPPAPKVDRRRRTAADVAEERHEYDKLYDLPKTEISPERAREIERDSWSTTKILTEAFSDSEPTFEDSLLSDITPISDPVDVKDSADETVTVSAPSLPATPKEDSEYSLIDKIGSEIGEIVGFIELCRSPSITEQRRFASSHSLSIDEIADAINECAANIFGDIVLEEDGGAYKIIEDYLDRF